MRVKDIDAYALICYALLLLEHQKDTILAQDYGQQAEKEWDMATRHLQWICDYMGEEAFQLLISKQNIL